MSGSSFVPAHNDPVAVKSGSAVLTRGNLCWSDAVEPLNEERRSHTCRPLSREKPFHGRVVRSKLCSGVPTATIFFRYESAGLVLRRLTHRRRQCVVPCPRGEMDIKREQSPLRVYGLEPHETKHAAASAREVRMYHEINDNRSEVFWLYIRTGSPYAVYRMRLRNLFKLEAWQTLTYPMLLMQKQVTRKSSLASCKI